MNIEMTFPDEMEIKNAQTDEDIPIARLTDEQIIELSLAFQEYLWFRRDQARLH